jgi:hypothetical protein
MILSQSPTGNKEMRAPIDHWFANPKIQGAFLFAMRSDRKRSSAAHYRKAQPAFPDI